MPMKPKEMVKYLKKNGFNEVKGGGSRGDEPANRGSARAREPSGV